jgi:hypothetical protein
MLTDISASTVAVCKAHCQILRLLYVLPHSRTPLGRLVHKGYSSRYLVTHNCNTSGFLAVFHFRGLLGITSYLQMLYDHSKERKHYYLVYFI